ncbi:MAG: hypothetical protein LBI17_02195 [Rickettsiales bacterium]|nr:hypothetical protein [Rickettsiales bacterium]
MGKAIKKILVSCSVLVFSACASSTPKVANDATEVLTNPTVVRIMYANEVKKYCLMANDMSCGKDNMKEYCMPEDKADRFCECWGIHLSIAYGIDGQARYLKRRISGEQITFVEDLTLPMETSAKISEYCKEKAHKNENFYERIDFNNAEKP